MLEGRYRQEVGGERRRRGRRGLLRSTREAEAVGEEEVEGLGGRETRAARRVAQVPRREQARAGEAGSREDGTRRCVSRVRPSHRSHTACTHEQQQTRRAKPAHCTVACGGELSNAVTCQSTAGPDMTLVRETPSRPTWRRSATRHAPCSALGPRGRRCCNVGASRRGAARLRLRACMQSRATPSCLAWPTRTPGCHSRSCPRRRPPDTVPLAPLPLCVLAVHHAASAWHTAFACACACACACAHPAARPARSHLVCIGARLPDRALFEQSSLAVGRGGWCSVENWSPRASPPSMPAKGWAEPAASGGRSATSACWAAARAGASGAAAPVHAGGGGLSDGRCLSTSRRPRPSARIRLLAAGRI